MTECPFMKTQNNINQFNSDCKKIMEDENKNTEKVKSKGSCPYMNNNEKKEIKKEEKEDTDDEQPQGGCPVMNKSIFLLIFYNIAKKDPANKLFETPNYEIPFFGPFDFIFNLRGGLSNKEYQEKTKQIRSYSRQMKYTLFSHNDENLKKLREKEFPIVFFAYDDIKDKGNKLYKKKKFREAIKYYQYVCIVIIF